MFGIEVESVKQKLAFAIFLSISWIFKETVRTSAFNL